jgi:hypothetical protein
VVSQQLQSFRSGTSCRERSDKNMGREAPLLHGKEVNPMEDREKQRDDRRDGEQQHGRKASSLTAVKVAARLLMEVVIRIVIGLLPTADDHE